MNWKIKNVATQAVKIVVSTASIRSVGIKLNPGDSVICLPRQTPTIDAQFRRKLIEIDKNFDNELYGLAMGIVYNDSQIEEMKMKKAGEDASDYVAKS